MSKKTKKEKIIYYDDGSTISDMSSVNKTGRPKQNKVQEEQRSFLPTVKPTSKWATYWQAVRMMVVPMLFVLGVLAILFLCLLGFSHCVGA